MSGFGAKPFQYHFVRWLRLPWGPAWSLLGSSSSFIIFLWFVVVATKIVYQDKPLRLQLCGQREAGNFEAQILGGNRNRAVAP